MEIRPLVITSVANMLPGGLLGAFGIERWSEAAGVVAHVGAALVVGAGLVLGLRGYRLGVRCDSKTLTVRGLLRSRKVTRSNIRAITDFPAIRWSGRSGRIVWTPIIAFAEPGGALPVVARRNEEAIEKLRRWVADEGEARSAFVRSGR